MDEHLRRLRHDLHRLAEPSGAERATAAFVAEALADARPARLVRDLGGHGLAALFEGEAHGPRVLIRCDMDALPIPEHLDLPHASTRAGVSHKCGHDGHMTLLLGLARRLAEAPLARGSAVLLFQPAEESGQGARAVLDDPAFAALTPDVALALHNLPGHPLGRVIWRESLFAFGSLGIIAKLTGASSHAAEPEAGRSPGLAMARLIEDITSYTRFDPDPERVEIATVIHARLGVRAFGTTPGEGEVMATLRSGSSVALARLTEQVERQAARRAAEAELSLDLERVEPFPPTVNDPRVVRRVLAAAEAAGLSADMAPAPFRWSEDFGHFTECVPAAMFGLGAGERQPPLHHPDYDFPDDLIAPGVELLDAAARRLAGADLEEGGDDV